MTNFRNTAEGGTEGTTVTAGSGGNSGGTSGDYFNNVVIGSGADIEFRAAAAVLGSMGYRIVLGTGTAYLRWDKTEAGSRAVMMRPFLVPSGAAATASITVMAMRNQVSDGIMASCVMTTTRTIRVSASTGGEIVGSASFALSLNTRYWLQMACTKGTTTSNGRIEMKIFSAAGAELDDYDSGATVNTLTVDPGQYRFGGFLSSQVTNWTNGDQMDELQAEIMASGFFAIPGLGTNYVKTPADTASITDTGAPQVIDWGMVLADPAAGTDTAADHIGDASADLAGIADALAMGRFMVPADAAAGADTVETLSGADAAAADVAAVADSVAAANDLDRGAADTAAAVDAVTTLALLELAAADSAAGADAVTGLGRAVQVDDTAGAVDGATPVGESPANPADTGAGSDAFTLQVSRDRADSAAGSDSVTVVTAFDRVPADDAGISDGATVDLATLGSQSPSDSATITEAELIERHSIRGASDTAAGTDTAGAGQSRTAGDSASGADAPAAVVDAARLPGDAAAGSDSASAELASGNTRAPADSGAGVDAVFWSLVRTITDNAGAAEALAFGRAIAPSDGAAGVDQSTPAAGAQRGAADAAAAGDSVIGGLGFDRLITTDQAAGADSVTTALPQFVTIEDLADGADVAETSSDAVERSEADEAWMTDFMTAVLEGPFGVVPPRILKLTIRDDPYGSIVGGG